MFDYRGVGLRASAQPTRAGAKSLLHRSPSVFSRRWFNLSFLQPTNCTGKTGGNTGMDCDEYPYYSTLEGGLINYLANSVFLKPVNKAHNRAAGGLLGGFYSAAQISPMLGEFYTIPMIDLAKTIYVHK